MRPESLENRNGVVKTRAEWGAEDFKAIASKVIAEDTPVKSPKEIPKETPKEAASETPKAAPKEAPKETPKPKPRKKRK